METDRVQVCRTSSTSSTLTPAVPSQLTLRRRIVQVCSPSLLQSTSGRKSSLEGVKGRVDGSLMRRVERRQRLKQPTRGTVQWLTTASNSLLHHSCFSVLLLPRRRLPPVLPSPLLYTHLPRPFRGSHMIPHSFSAAEHSFARPFDSFTSSPRTSPTRLPPTSASVSANAFSRLAGRVCGYLQPTAAPIRVYRGLERPTRRPLSPSSSFPPPLSRSGSHHAVRCRLTGQRSLRRDVVVQLEPSERSTTCGS